MESKEYLQDISDIKSLMRKSSRFASLNGLSGIMAGIYALLGASFVFFGIDQFNGSLTAIHDESMTVLGVLGAVAFLSIATAVILTIRQAKQTNENIWDNTSKRLISNFLIPLIAGGLYISFTLGTQSYGQSAALMLIFYGLALISASKHSTNAIKLLGLMEIILGLICALYPAYGFWLWVLGFGLVHICYGFWMHFKIDNKHRDA